MTVLGKKVFKKVFKGMSVPLTSLFYWISNFKFAFKSGCQHLYNYEKSLETNAFQGFFFLCWQLDRQLTIVSIFAIL